MAIIASDKKLLSLLVSYKSLWLMRKEKKNDSNYSKSFELNHLNSYLLIVGKMFLTFKCSFY